MTYKKIINPKEKLRRAIREQIAYCGIEQCKTCKLMRQLIKVLK
jgi:hypothetical protein